MSDFYGMRPFEVPEDSIKNLYPDKEKAMEIINAPLKKEWIKKRPAGGGRQLDYIEGGRVKKILNDAFGSWSWEVIHWEIRESFPRKDRSDNQFPQPPYALIHGRLTIPGFGVREAFGSKVIQFSEGADQQAQALKSAETDALKVAASYFGVALELYYDDDLEEIAEKREQPRGNVAEQYKDAPVVKNEKESPWAGYDEDLSKLRDLKAILNIEDNDQLNPFVSDWSGGRLKSYRDIAPDNIKAFNAYLESKLNN